MSLEDAFWNAIHEIAAKHGVKVGELVSTIDSDRQHSNLSSAIRLFVLDHYLALAERRAAQRPRKLEINLRTTRLLGLTTPDSILARADKVIE